MELKRYKDFLNEKIYISIKGLKDYQIQSIRPGYRKSDYGHAIVKFIYNDNREVSLLIENYGKIEDKELIVKVFGSSFKLDKEVFENSIDKLLYILNKNLLKEKFKLKSINYDKNLESYSIIETNNVIAIDKLEQILTSTKIINNKVKNSDDDLDNMIYKTIENAESKENNNLWTYDGNFKVNKSMILNGKFIKDKIPDIVTGDFDCSFNKLTSLEGGPKEVGGWFECSNNQLTSLEGGPKEVGGVFDCSYNDLTSLEGGPKEVGGYFDCSDNQLTSLEGGPKEVGGDFDCSYNELKSLEEVPKYLKSVSSDFKIEDDFINSGSYINNYFEDLLKYMIDKKKDLTKVNGWPEGFLTDEMIKSTKGISKFNL